jgi:hypothetical protein
MNRIAKYCFIYGCVASALALVWYVASILGYVLWPEGPWVVVSMFVVHGIVMVLTFHRDPARTLWSPLIPITPNRLRAAKAILAAAVANFLLCLILMLLGNRPASLRMLSTAFASLALLNMVYVAIHWAVRPENLFPRQLLAFVSSPIGYLFFRRSRRRRKSSSTGSPSL